MPRFLQERQSGRAIERITLEEAIERQRDGESFAVYEDPVEEALEFSPKFNRFLMRKPVKLGVVRNGNPGRGYTIEELTAQNVSAGREFKEVQHPGGVTQIQPNTRVVFGEDKDGELFVLHVSGEANELLTFKDRSTSPPLPPAGNNVLSKVNGNYRSFREPNGTPAGGYEGTIPLVDPDNYGLGFLPPEGEVLHWGDVSPDGRIRLITSEAALFWDRTDNTLKIRSDAAVDQITLDDSGAAVFNEQGNDADFRVEASGHPNAFFVQGSDGFIGINIPAPLNILHLTVASASDEGIRFTADDDSYEVIIRNAGATNDDDFVIQYDPGKTGTYNNILAYNSSEEYWEVGSDGANVDGQFRLNSAGSSAGVSGFFLGTDSAADSLGDLFIRDGTGAGNVRIFFYDRGFNRINWDLSSTAATNADVTWDSPGFTFLNVNSGSTSSDPGIRLRENADGANRLEIVYANAADQANYICRDGGVNDLHSFRDDLDIVGTLSKGSGTFLIDHPLDPFNKDLHHQFLESPECRLLYCGTVTLSAGKATAALPPYFHALCKSGDYVYSLTAHGDARAWVSREIADGVFDFEISASADVKVSWQVWALRNDRFIQANPPQVEVPKKTLGELRHPQCWPDRIDQDVRYCANDADDPNFDPTDPNCSCGIFSSKVRDENFHADYATKYKARQTSRLQKIKAANP